MLDVLTRLCTYWDTQLWGDKVTDTNWYYSGLIACKCSEDFSLYKIGEYI